PRRRPEPLPRSRGGGTGRATPARARRAAGADGDPGTRPLVLRGPRRGRLPAGPDPPPPPPGAAPARPRPGGDPHPPPAVGGLPRHRSEAILDSHYLTTTDARLVRTLREAGYVAEAARPLGECLVHAEARARDERRLARLTADGPRLLALRDVVAALAGVRT